MCYDLLSENRAAALRFLWAVRCNRMVARSFTFHHSFEGSQLFARLVPLVIILHRDCRHERLFVLQHARMLLTRVLLDWYRLFSTIFDEDLDRLADLDALEYIMLRLI